jgi:hypothetical protein
MISGAGVSKEPASWLSMLGIGKTVNRKPPAVESPSPITQIMIDSHKSISRPSSSVSKRLSLDSSGRGHVIVEKCIPNRVASRSTDPDARGARAVDSAVGVEVGI